MVVLNTSSSCQHMCWMAGNWKRNSLGHSGSLTYFLMYTISTKFRYFDFAKIYIDMLFHFHCAFFCVSSPKKLQLNFFLILVLRNRNISITFKNLHAKRTITCTCICNSLHLMDQINRNNCAFLSC